MPRGRLQSLLDRWLRRAAARQYRRHRQTLLDRFTATMADSGEPEGLTWNAVQPTDGETIVSATPPLRLTVLQPIAVTFDAIPDGGMEDAPALHTTRAAVAMFHYDGRDWAIGRCLFNVDADEVAQRLAAEG